jgi:hypothetical protein
VIDEAAGSQFSFPRSGQSRCRILLFFRRLFILREQFGQIRSDLQLLVSLFHGSAFTQRSGLRANAGADLRET